MGAAEIVIIVCAVLVVLAAIVTYIVRKLKGKPTGECACCPHAKSCKNCGDCGGKLDLSKYLDNKPKGDQK